METAVAADNDACPFVRPASPRGCAVTEAMVYCRLPRGAVRVPARDEFVRYCATGNFTACPIYQRHARREL